LLDLGLDSVDIVYVDSTVGPPGMFQSLSSANPPRGIHAGHLPNEMSQIPVSRKEELERLPGVLLRKITPKMHQTIIERLLLANVFQEILDTIFVSEIRNVSPENIWP
jgi:predicted ATPase with chaperone activity